MQRHILIATGLLFVLACVLTPGQGVRAQDKSYTYATEPPDGSVPCGKTVTVKSSKKCGGKPATITGGCNRGGSGSGARRQIRCGK